MEPLLANPPPPLRTLPEASPRNYTEISPEMGEMLSLAIKAYREMDVSVLDQLGAAYALVASPSLLFATPKPPSETDPDIDPNFNPLLLLNTDELARYGSVYATAKSMSELEWLRQERQRLDRLYARLANGPLHPLVAGLIAGIFDPINLLPLGWVTQAVRGAGLGAKMAQGALVGAAANLAVDPFLREANPFRDFTDTLEDVLVGGLFGAGIGALAHLPRFWRGGEPRSPEAQAERDAISRRIDEAEAARTGMTPEDMAKLRQGFRDAVNELNNVQAARVARETGVETGLASKPGSGTAGAAYTAQSKIIDDALREVALELTGPRWLKTVLQKGFGSNRVTEIPGIELATSRFQAAREIIFKIADTGMYTKASAREMTDADLKEAYKRAVAKGLVESEEDFFAEARKRIETGIPMADFAPLFSRIAYKEHRLYRAVNEFMAAYQEAQEQGFKGTWEEFSDEVGRFGRYKDEPGRFPTNPFANTPWRPALERAFNKAWKEAISYPARRDFEEVKPWADVADGAQLREDHYSKMFDPEKIRADLPGFKAAWMEYWTRRVEEAKARVAAYEDALEAYNNRVQDARVLIEEIRKSPILRKNPKAKYFLEALLAEKKAAEEVNKLEAQVRKELGMSAWEFMKKMDDQGGPPRSPEPEFKTVEEQFYDALTEAYKKRDEAGRLYEAARKKVGEGIALATGRRIPPSIGARPEKPPSYDADKKLIGPIEEGGLGSPGAIEAHVEKSVKEIAFGAELHRYLDGGLRGFLKGRTLDIDPVLFEPFLQKSFLRTIEQYNSMVARDLEVLRTFNTLDVAEIVQPISKEAVKLQQAARERGDLAEVKAIADEAERNIAVIKDLIEKARGTFDRPDSKFQQTVQAGVRAGMSIAFTAKMGSGLLAQVADPVKAISVYGASRVFRAFARYLADVWAGTAKDMTKRAREQFGTALDQATLSQHRLLLDIAPAGAPLGAVGRGIDRMTALFSKLTLMPWWNDQLRIIGTYLVDDLMMEGALAAKKGKPVPREAAELFSLAGLNREQVLALGEMYEKYGTMRGGLRDSNLEEWALKNPELAETYRLAAHVGAQRMLITPTGADRPFWTQKTLGAAAMQFRGFIMASLPHLLVPFLQSPAGKKIEIAIAALAFGTLSTVLRDLNSRGEIKDRSPAQWVIDALDMSGLTSILTEADATLGHISPYLSAKRMLTGEDLTRWENRTRIGALLGPAAGMVGDLASALHGFLDAAVTDRDLAIKDVRAFRSVMPYQNWILSRHGLDVLEAVMFEDAKARGLIAPYLYPDRPRP